MSWESFSPAWQAAFEEAWSAWRAGSLPVGCAITDRAGEILFTGRNRIEEASAPPGLLSGNHLAHAEMNALALLRPDEVNPRSVILHTTLEPCPMCTGAIRMMNIGTVSYAARDALDGSIALLDANPHMRRAGISVSGPTTAEMELVSQVLFIAAFLRLYPGTDLAAGVVDDFQSLAPDAVRRARQLHNSGTLEELSASGAPVADLYAAVLGDNSSG